MKTLRLILGDQLTATLPIIQQCDPQHDCLLMCEVKEEATYVKHHKKKIAFIFSAMRHFAKEIQETGAPLMYRRYDDPVNQGSLYGEVEHQVKTNGFEQVLITEPGEYRLLEEIKQWPSRLGIPVQTLPDPRFLCDHETFEQWSKGKKQLRMEFFYRELRRKFGILMDSGKPIGDQWNFDSDNRKPPKKGLAIPKPFTVEHDSITCEVLKLVEASFSSHFGNLEPFYFAVNRKQALAALSLFIKERLENFGHYQDAMIENEPWMYHAHLSFYLNCGLLTPDDCIEAAEKAYHELNAPLNAVEGFIRQILGWREFVRGMYWLKMPQYKTQNYFDAMRPLPEFFWSANTNLNCLRQCISETKENAYAHHIQRLMVIGNFATLTGLSPTAVNEWFLIVYADAFEWVELPNVTGMALFADGGELASKPYIAGGAYINKMSNYCTHCAFDVKAKTGSKACPFNYLYWNFLITHQQKLNGNPRLGMMYRNLEKMQPSAKQAIQDSSDVFFKSL